MAVQLIIMALLVIMSAYFSATETAFSTFNKTKMKTLAEGGNATAALVCRLAENYDRLLSTILIGNNIVNIALASIGTILFVNALGDIGATVSTAVVTVVVLIFGEISPKSAAKNSPEKFALFSAKIINALIYIFMPLNFLFAQWKKLVNRIFKPDADTKLSQEELLMLVDEVQEGGSIDKSEGELLRNAIEFTERDAEDILTHRVDLEAVPLDATKEEIARVFTESKFSRILVYEESIDHIVGVIHLKDFYTGDGITEKPIKDIMTPPIFIMKHEKIDTILRELQRKKSHIAVVVDEYGGTYGIVTMEDILEELVGEIFDEHDEKSEDVQRVDNDTYLVDGSMDMSDFCEQFHISPETDAISLGGWIMEELGQIPEDGDGFDYENISVRVIATEGHRVSNVEVKILPEEKAEEEAVASAE
ncbi:MAG TPA: HlyC/CorC family transporter [Clostridiales bacterium]|nr:HlyC/CorC family transporter [Clostridiales bacterium]